MSHFKEIQEKEDDYDTVLYDYIIKHKLTKKNRLLFVSKKFYYYNEQDLKNIKTVIFIQKFNDIKHLDDMIENLYKILKNYNIICGRFVDSRADKVNLPTYQKLFNMFSDFLSIKPNKSLSSKQLTAYFNAYNFKIVDMTEINNITYFYAKKIKQL